VKDPKSACASHGNATSSTSLREHMERLSILTSTQFPHLVPMLLESLLLIILEASWPSVYLGAFRSPSWYGVPATTLTPSLACPTLHSSLPYSCRLCCFHRRCHLHSPSSSVQQIGQQAACFPPLAKMPLFQLRIHKLSAD